MAFIGACGFEENSFALESINAFGAGTTIVTTPVHGGIYALRTTGFVSATRTGVVTRFVLPSNGPWYMRLYFQYHVLPTIECGIIAMTNGTGINSSQGFAISIDQDGTLGMYAAGAFIGGRSTALAIDTWYRIEVHYDRTPSIGNHIVDSQLAVGEAAATQWVSSNTLNLNGSISTIITGGNLGIEAQTAGDWYFDDIQLHDNTTGGTCTTYPGPGIITHIWPNANGDLTTWTPSGTASTANWGYVGLTHDRPTPDDAGTIISSNTLNNADSYTNIGPLPPLASTDIISVVAGYARYAGAGASANASFAVGIQSKTGGTLVTGPPVSPPSTAFVTGQAQTQMGPNIVTYLAPTGNVAWTKAKVAQVASSVSLTTTSTNAVQVSALWLQVISTPAGGSGGGGSSAQAFEVLIHAAGAPGTPDMGTWWRQNARAIDLSDQGAGDNSIQTTLMNQPTTFKGLIFGGPTTAAYMNTLIALCNSTTPPITEVIFNFENINNVGLTNAQFLDNTYGMQLVYNQLAGTGIKVRAAPAGLCYDRIAAVQADLNTLIANCDHLMYQAQKDQDPNNIANWPGIVAAVVAKWKANTNKEMSVQLSTTPPPYAPLVPTTAQLIRDVSSFITACGATPPDAIKIHYTNNVAGPITVAEQTFAYFFSITPPPPTVPAVLQSASGAAGSSSTSATLAAAPTLNNLLVAIVANDGGNGPTIPGSGLSNWLTDGLITYSTGNSSRITVLYRLVVAGDSATVTVTAAGATVTDLHLFEIANVSPNLASIADVVFTTSDSGTAVTTLALGPTPALAQASELVLAAIGTDGTPGALVGSWTNGYTTGLGTQRLMSSFVTTTATAGQSTTGTWTRARRAAGIMVSFNSAPVITKNLYNLPMAVRMTTSADVTWWNNNQASGVLRITDWARFAPTEHPLGLPGGVPGVNAGLIQLQYNNWLSTSDGHGLTPSAQGEIASIPITVMDSIVYGPYVPLTYGTEYTNAGLATGSIEQASDDSVIGGVGLMAAGFDLWVDPDSAGYDANIVSMMGNPEVTHAEVRSQVYQLKGSGNTNQQLLVGTGNFDDLLGNRMLAARAANPNVQISMQISLDFGDAISCYATLTHMLTGTTPAGIPYGPPDAIVMMQTTAIGNGQMDAFMNLLRPQTVASLRVDAITPAVGGVAGGTPITIAGVGFQVVPTMPVVTLGGIACTKVTGSTTQLTALTPSHTVAVVDLTVRNANTDTFTLSQAFQYLAAPPPAVTAIAPATGSTIGGTAVTITGSSFIKGAGLAVKIGNAAATAVVWVSSTQVTCTTGANAAGLVGVAVTNPDGQTGTQSGLYTYVAPPTVTSVSPNSGSTVGGTAVTIIGTVFTYGARVTIGGVAATLVNILNPTKITCKTPAHAAGATSILVTNPDGQVNAANTLYTYSAPLAAPTITSFSPTTGPTSGQTLITIIGTNFVTGATATIDSTLPVAATFVSSTQVTCLTPPHAPGTATVKVTNPDTQTATAAGTFLYTQALRPITVTISGVNQSTVVDVSSFQIDQILTRRGDNAKLTILDTGNTLTIPRWATVTITDDQGNVMFKGWVTKQKQRPVSAAQRRIDLTCQDATVFLNGRGQNRKYVSWYVTDIARDLVLNASPSVGITANNTPAASGPIITFTTSHVALATTLTRLAKMASTLLATAGGGIYDWYVDYNQDLNFFVASTAPVSTVVLTDVKPTGTQLNYNRDTFSYELDDTQLGNSVLVRGAQVLSIPLTDTFIGDGITAGFTLSQAPDIPNGLIPFITVNGVIQTVSQYAGVTPTSQWFVTQDATSLLWSINIGLAPVPNLGDVIICTYQYDVPAFALAQNTTDIAALAGLPNLGQFDRLIIDTSIASQAAAIARANAELAAYGQAYKVIQVETQLVSTGAILGDAAAGKQIRVINSQEGIDVTMLCEKLTIRSNGPTSYFYQIGLRGIN